VASQNAKPNTNPWTTKALAAAEKGRRRISRRALGFEV